MFHCLTGNPNGDVSMRGLVVAAPGRSVARDDARPADAGATAENGADGARDTPDVRCAVVGTSVPEREGAAVVVAVACCCC